MKIAPKFWFGFRSIPTRGAARVTMEMSLDATGDIILSAGFDSNNLAGVSGEITVHVRE